MSASQDTRIHLSCRHFRCDSFRFDAQGRRLILPFSSTRQTGTAGCPRRKGNVHVHDHGVTVWHDPDPRGTLPPLPHAPSTAKRSSARHQHRQARGVQQPDTGGEADRLRLPGRRLFLHHNPFHFHPRSRLPIPQENVKSQNFGFFLCNYHTHI